jgi:hypothetical protein
MKKMFAIAILAVSITACNNSGKKESTTSDTSRMEQVGPGPVDTNHTIIDTTKPADSTAPKM